MCTRRQETWGLELYPPQSEIRYYNHKAEFTDLLILRLSKKKKLYIFK